MCDLGGWTCRATYVISGAKFQKNIKIVEVPKVMIHHNLLIW